eukprot:scaffold137958_cov34-Tisochrysis_lutea.AAC.2
MMGGRKRGGGKGSEGRCQARFLCCRSLARRRMDVADSACAPKQLSTHCNCPQTVDPKSPLPICIPTTPCRDPSAAFSREQLQGDVAFVVALDFNQTRVRYWYRDDPFESYAASMRLIMRLVLSLRRVKSTLPVVLLASGQRHEGYETRLKEYNVSILDGSYSLRLPSWVNPFHIASFSKLLVLSLTQYAKVIVLDQDLVVLRNIDHLVYVPSPAFVYRYKIPPCTRLEINSGLMVLTPSAPALARLRHMMLSHNHITPMKGDMSDQNVWRFFFSHVHGLPIGYNAFRSAALTAPAGWDTAYVLHDIWKFQGLGGAGPTWWRKEAGESVHFLLTSLSKEAQEALHGLPTVSKTGARHNGLPFR